MLTSPANTHLLNRFLRFVETARPLAAGPALPASAGTFRHFCAAAKALLAERQELIPIGAFERFVTGAQPLLVAGMRATLPDLIRRARLLQPWLARHDLLSVAGLSYVENAYTNLMAWALAAETHPPSACRRQLAWLRLIGLDNCLDVQPCTPHVQFSTEDGIPDLVLDYPTFTVVVEAKTGSAEHAAPSGTPQTHAYPPAVRKALGKPTDWPLTMVYLTPDGRAGSNTAAQCVRYADFAVSLAESLEGVDPRSDVGAGFALIVTHLLTAATETEQPVHELVAGLVLAGERVPALDDVWLVKHMDLLLAATSLFHGTQP